MYQVMIFFATSIYLFMKEQILKEDLGQVRQQIVKTIAGLK